MLLDTVVLVGGLNPEDDHHVKADAYLAALSTDPEVFIPAVVMLEFDLLMKARGYNPGERHATWLELAPKIPTEKVLSPTVNSSASAALLEQEGLAYFDALITAQALELGSEIATTDQVISRHASTIW